MKTAQSDNQKQQNSITESSGSVAQQDSTVGLVAPSSSTSEESLQLLVQARLSVSSPSDPFELEAENMANEFVKSIHGRSVSAPTQAAGSVARSVPDSGLVEGGAGLATTDDTASAIMSARSGGQALSGDVRSRFEGFFGADLGGVKVHNDGTSDNLCRSINAEAFTTGNDVFFSSRSFKPGSSSGDHLLAHELTHVVQQGNAPALARRATPDIQREKGLPSEDGKATKAAAAGEGVGLGKIGSSIFTGVRGDSEIANPSLQAQDVKDASISGGSLGLVASLSALFSTLVRLHNDWDKETTSSARDQLIAAVKSAVTVCQNSTSIAATAGATVASGAIPGIGLAYSTIDLAVQSVKIHETNKARAAADERIAEIQKLNGASRTLEDRKMLVSLTNLSASAKSEYIRSIFRLTSDLISMGGQITLLVTGPTGIGAAVGGALVAVGAIGQGVVALQGKIAEWSSAGAINASRADLAQAKADLEAHQASLSGDPTDDQSATTKQLSDRVDDLTVENLGIDAYAAAAQLIKNSAALIDQDGNFDPEALALVGQFNISQTWMLNYVKGGASPAMLDKGAKLICEFVGASPNAKGLIADLKSAAAWVGRGIKWVASAGYWVLKFATKAVLMLAIVPFTPLLGLFSSLTGRPELGHQFIDAYEKALDTVGGAIESTVGAGVDAIANIGKGGETEKPKVSKPYFVDRKNLEQRTTEIVEPILTTYFAEKAERGTDVKGDGVTSRLKTPYAQLLAMAKDRHADGTPPFAGPDVQMALVDETVKALICKHAPDRVDKDSVKCGMGKVSFTYIGDDKAKTKGWFASFRGRVSA